MPRGASLSPTEQSAILALHRNKISMNNIATQLNRSRCVVQRFLKNPTAYNSALRPGRPPKLTESGKRLLLREAKKGMMKANDLRQALNLPISKKRVQAILRDDPNIEYRRMIKGPWMTKEHRNRRVEWAMNRTGFGFEYWKNMIFSDEKKFNLDGPDGMKSYWHNVDKEIRTFSKRQNRGGGVMVWGGFSSKGTTVLVLICGKQNAKKHIQVLQDYLLPFANHYHRENWVFQQDGASIQTAKIIQKLLADRKTPTLKWPARSPDLHFIENLWAIIAARVYGNARRFHTVEKLTECVLTTWANLDPAILTKLVGSMPRRIGEVLKQQGGPTKC